MRAKLKVAIIGFGSRGRTYALVFREFLGERVQVVAVADTDGKGATARLEGIGLSAKVYATPRELIAQEKRLDGLIICSPDHVHLESFRAIASLKKPLLFEKPLEGNGDNFKILARELLAYPSAVVVGHCMRQAPILKKARELIDQGWIGRVNSMRFVQNCHYGDVFFRSWHRRSETITSLYIEKATHDFDIMHMLNGDHYATAVFAFSKRYKFGGDMPNDLCCPDCPKEVECPESLLNLATAIHGEKMTNPQERAGRDKCVWSREADIGDDEMCMIEFSNGVQGVYTQTFYTPANYSGRVYTVVGDKGVLDIDMGHFQGKISFYPRYGTKNDRMIYEFDYLGRNHYNGDAYLVRNFLGVMEGREESLTTVQAAVAAEQLGLAAAKSVQSRLLQRVEEI